jgi:hypothetical protein
MSLPAAFMGESNLIAANFEGDMSSLFDGVNTSCGCDRFTAPTDFPEQLFV